MREAGAAYIIRGGRILGFRMNDGGAVCYKKRFGDVSSARDALRSIAEHATDDPCAPVLFYRCEFCRGFHLKGQR